jgi:hypothetical protein
MAVETVRQHGPRSTSLRVFSLLVAALREIFDEAAYRRFLERNRMQRSRESYAKFVRENEAATARRPRCC